MKSVLYIGAGAPWVGGAGYLVRQRMFLRALAEVSQLSLAMFDLPAVGSGSEPRYVSSLKALPKPVRKQETGLVRLGADLMCPVPRMFRGSRSREARRIVSALRPESFDAVFAFRIDFAHFAGVLQHPRLLLDIDDPEHLRWKRQLCATTVDGGDWRTRKDLEKLARFEKRAVSSAYASFVCQEHDRTAFQPLPIVVPNCVDVPQACPPRRAGRQRIVFIGNFAKASPNLDALNWFLDEIWPLIRKQSPECEIHVIGRLTGEPEGRVLATPGAVAAGFVADLRAAMEEASLSIAPIRYGTGTRVKIIESFALGCPVVSTTLGFEGIEARAGEHLLIGDSPAEFAAQCLALLRDREAQARIGAAGYTVAASYYNEQARRNELVQTLGGLLDRCAKQKADSPSTREGLPISSSEDAVRMES